MKTFFAAAAFAVTATGAIGATVDFADPAFDSTFGPIIAPFTDTQVIDGVTFNFAAESRGANGYRQIDSVTFVPVTVRTPIGLTFGPGGNGMEYLEFVASEDLIIESLAGIDQSNIDSDTTELPISISVGGVSQGSSSFSSSGSIWDFADITLTAGTVFRIADAGTGDPNSNAVLGQLQFSIADSVTPVPLPAGLPLMLVGLGALGLAKRRKG